jgi:hypothetical protein
MLCNAHSFLYIHFEVRANGVQYCSTDIFSSDFISLIGACVF